MKMSHLLGLRFKETPADCQIASQILMLRGGYIKGVGNGIYSLFTPTKRITQKIEAILRDEMDRLGGQEVMFPVAMPADLWKESGRFESVGSELLRFKDRGGNDMILGMTHEEAAVHLARNVAQSYSDYPFMIYQIQTKFRDEPRARGGLIRVREFTMKDAYSFHTSQEDLDEYYKKCYDAYNRIYARCGIPEVFAVQGDSGMMGGKVSHEFMLPTEVGEDTLVVCDECDFRSNMEVAPCIVDNEVCPDAELIMVPTPDSKTIEEICALLSVSEKQTCKAVLYRKESDNALVVVFLRGDLEVNEVKLRNFLKSEIHPEVADENNTDITYGFIGPVGFEAKAIVIYDRSFVGAHNLVCGANKVGFHYTGFTPERDLPSSIEFIDVAKTYPGAVCPVCGKKSIRTTRGIEVGNIFQLGKKYSEPMNMRYSDKNGEMQTPIMGCYGIGVGRLAASVCEACRDDYGPIWPISIAPWQVHICALRSDNEQVAETSNRIYEELQNKGVEVLFDDRPVSAGFMFSDADLLGVPVRITISPKTCARGVAEVSLRDKSFKQDMDLDTVVDNIKQMVDDMLAKFSHDAVCSR